ncbi:hypothetical protein L0Z16_08300 [Burkholderia multivorans]|nr:hypothetical protein [Burkholderia multivorans]MCO1356789.1 hypothetical protein [Burkholderia multivorans]UQP42212.1 hypothetical protein L0Z16_08300 [Burkholderia multivorans]
MFALRGVEEEDEDLTYFQAQMLLLSELRYNLGETEIWLKDAAEQMRQEQAEYLASLPNDEERKLAVQKVVSDAVKYIVERDRHKVDKNKPI